ncbi:TetR family transcriptional regulator [Nocardiopsis sp. Huas11]|uniref:TetR/AcrR family transcriptional regulator n=1 Tax=Nocardiopsis sp. Huas11 TaxID=2183912 RepID=UPI000F169E4F|nr:TetR/AcrR family transcriptional regulator [Nocardiopsis sp. Huas11]RKS06380.1 TetR family transcriptional regulator [Nocardiopsis sp. Huas11]
MTQRQTGRRVGRPRAAGTSPTGGDSTEDVLRAAAELFTSQGFSATSTRAVAERAGLRQASLYHLFANKDAILARLLEGTVGPSLTVAQRLERHPAPAPVRLWALCRADVELLCSGPYNVGALYLSPEVGRGRFEDFHARRDALRDHYARLVAQAAPEADGRSLPDLVFGLVESVILRRGGAASLDGHTAAAEVADGALRLLGTSESALAGVRAAGLELYRATRG